MFGLFRNKTRDAQVARIYDQILAQARDPTFYLAGGVPDTVEGRTDMMLLHLFLLMHRLREEAGETLEVARSVCDRFFVELDRAMREMGVGDLAVPKKMRKIADIYAGCSASYGKAVIEANETALKEALWRNIYGKRADRLVEADAMTSYVQRSVSALAGRQARDLITDRIPFASFSPASDVSA